MKNTIQSDPQINQSTKLLVIIMGILTGLTGSMHGIAEILQGNKPTEGLVLAGVGVLTVIPNYLCTGIVSTLLGAGVITWTITSVHKKSDPSVYLLLSILLFLTGGGIAITALFLITWGLATIINKPLIWWRKVLSEKIRKSLSGL